jgi:hypothetical protein
MFVQYGEQVIVPKHSHRFGKSYAMRYQVAGGFLKIHWKFTYILPCIFVHESGPNIDALA